MTNKILHKARIWRFWAQQTVDAFSIHACWGFRLTYSYLHLQAQLLAEWNRFSPGARQWRSGSKHLQVDPQTKIQKKVLDLESKKI